jgi:hypothetical protein
VLRIGQLYVPRNGRFAARDWHIMITLSLIPPFETRNLLSPTASDRRRSCSGRHHQPGSNGLPLRSGRAVGDVPGRTKPDFDPTTPQAHEAWQAIAR